MQDVWSTWLALVKHYKGGGQQEKQMLAAVNTIKALHYKNKFIFSFKEFLWQLIQAYQDLESTDKEMTMFNKVKIMLEKVQVNVPWAKVAKSYVRQNF